MRHFRIIIFGIVTLCIIGCFTFSKTYAYSEEHSYYYSTTTKTYPALSLENDGTYAKTAYANTRPTSGTGGVLLTIEYYDGRVISSGVFPYQTSRSDLTGSVPGSNIARVGIAPYGNQGIAGTLHYGWQ